MTKLKYSSFDLEAQSTDADLLAMSPEPFGVYIRLRDSWWINGWLSGAPETLARISHCDLARFTEVIWPVVANRFVADSTGRLTEKILKNLRASVVLKVKNSIKNGRKGGRPKKLREVTPDNPGVIAGLSESEPSPLLLPITNTNSNSPKEKKKSRKSWAEEIYQAYPKHVGKRKAIEAIEKIIKQLDGGRFSLLGGAEEFLLESVTLYAASPAGQAGKFTPHPATWFNQERYDDDPKEWQQRNGDGNDSPARLRSGGCSDDKLNIHRPTD